MNAIASILLAALISGDAAAQSTSATLSGVIVDEQRAVLRDAAITLTSLDTGALRTASSDDTGAFQLTGLTPGRYELRVTRSGFAPKVHGSISLTVGEEATIDPVLRLASVSQTVDVQERTECHPWCADSYSGVELPSTGPPRLRGALNNAG